MDTGDAPGLSLQQALGRLASGDPEAQRSAAHALAALGDPAAIPALTRAFHTDNWLVRGASVRAILAIGGERALSDFAGALREGDARIRNAAVDILRGLGRRAAEALERMLLDHDANLVRYAAELLGEIGDPVATGSLLKTAASHPDENARYQSLLALGKLGAREALPVLRKALFDTLWVQTAALESIGLLRISELEQELLGLIGKTEIWALPTVLDALGHVGGTASLRTIYDFLVTDEELSQFALRALAGIAARTGGALPFEGRERDNILAVARKALSSEDSGLRRAGVNITGSFADTGAIPRLIPLLSAETGQEIEEDEAAAAAGALKATKGAAEGPLLEAYTKLNVTGQILAIDILSHVGGPPSAALLAQLLDHEDSEINRAACEGLGRLQDTRFVDALLFQFQHPSAAVRSAAQRALARMPAAEVYGKLAALLSDPLSEVRAMAAATLGELKDTRAIEPLKHLLIDPSNEVKRAAVFALASIEERRVGSLPLLLLGNDDPVLRRSAAQVLGQLSDPRAVEPLIYLLGDRDFWVRFHAARSLGQIGDKRAVAPILERLGDEMGPVRVAAAEALARLAPGGHLDRVSPLASDEDPDVRLAIVQLVGEWEGPDARAVLRRAFDDPAWRVRHAALLLAARSPSEEVLQRARQCLRDGHVLVRRAAGELIGEVERAVGIGGAP